MKTNRIFLLISVTYLLFNSGILHPAIILPNENNSVLLAGELSSEIIQNPSGSLVPFYIDKLSKLAPFCGRTLIVNSLKEALKKLEGGGENAALARQFLNLSINELDSSYNGIEKNFSILKKWNISGPWKRYGKPDTDYEFQPEKIFKIENIERGRNLSTEKNGTLFPYRFHHEADETLYATSSFTVSGDIILWIISDARYKLIINGVEIPQNTESGKKEIKAFTLSGSRGYTVQVKMQSSGENDNPYIKAMVTDSTHLPVKLSGSSMVFNFNFTYRKIFSSEDAGESVPQEAAVLTGRMNKLILSGNYIEGYKLGLSVIEKFPMYFDVYNEFIPLLDIMNRDDEFHLSIEKFLKVFPGSEIHNKWLAEFYMTRDRDKFSEIMRTVPSDTLSEKSIEVYISRLCGENKYSDALALCNSLKENPRFRHIIPELIKASGDSNLWRKTLIEGAADDDADFYYALGLAEMQIGLDPVMYWKKGYSLDNNPGLLRDLSDLYENGIFGVNDFYTGIYTDLHPELIWNAKKRKISVHIFESGRVIIEGEDIIPSGKKIRNEKLSESGIEFSSGEIKTAIPYLQGLKVLYVLTAKDGLPSPVDFNSVKMDRNRLEVIYKSGDEEFSVVKYSGEYLRDKTDIFSLVKGLQLKAQGENISMLDYEIICHGNFTPLISYNGEAISAGRYSDGIIKSGLNEKFDDGDTGSVISGISKFSSDKEFAQWYSSVITYAGKSTTQKNTEISKTENTESIVRKIHFYVMSSVSKRGDINFNPAKADSVLIRGEGTVEERTLLARGILENNGIKSFVSFRKSKEGLIDKILLYVPENRDSGYWLDFYGEGILNTKESGSDAVVITGEGYETFPVNPETYIR